MRRKYAARLAWGQALTLAATSKSPTLAGVKILQLTAAGRGDDYALTARLATRSAASFSRQLLPSNFSRFPRCIKRSSNGATTTTSPRSFDQSSMGLLDVRTVENFSYRLINTSASS